MSVTLYYSKVNINSHIFNVYDDKTELNRILMELYLNIQEGSEYFREEARINDSGEMFIYNAKYKFNTIEKFDGVLADTIVGTIMKDYPVFVNEPDPITGKIRKVAVENVEVIEFFFDVLNEIVAFHTTQRFGYQEFNIALKGLLNLSMSKHDEEYNFEVALLKEGLSVKDIKEQLKSIGKLEALKITIIPPNPDDDLLDSIHNNGEQYLNRIKAGNVTQRSILFTSKARQGLNIDADVMAEELNKIQEIHSELSSEEAVTNGYVTVEAINKEGRTFTTNDNRPVKDKLEDRSLTPKQFALTCKRKIAALFNSFL
jgi:hypothetical protein